MQTLFEIAEEMQALEGLLAEANGDVTDEKAEELIAGHFSDAAQKLEIKVENYCRLITLVQARSKARREEAERLLERSKVDERMAKGLKERLVVAMESLEMDKIETERYRVTVANNGGKQKIELNPEKITQEWLKPEFVPDYDNIRRSLEAGETLDFAHFKPRGKHLRIT